MFAWHTCTIKNISKYPESKTKDVIRDTINFSTQVQPILVKHCSPCHFPGGKLYEKLPFDKDTTIIHHVAGILKRIKNEDESTIIRSFVLQNKNG
jgi:hypothetical protein